jgi:hypothetical protein
MSDETVETVLSTDQALALKQIREIARGLKSAMPPVPGITDEIVFSQACMVWQETYRAEAATEHALIVAGLADEDEERRMRRRTKKLKRLLTESLRIKTVVFPLSHARSRSYNWRTRRPSGLTTSTSARSTFCWVLPRKGWVR